LLSLSGGRFLNKTKEFIIWQVQFWNVQLLQLLIFLL
jgi:hypothetical protein